MRFYILLLFLACGKLSAQQPQLHYTLKIDSADLSRFSVTLQINDAPPDFRIAMAAHPEYDDRFWRYVKDLSISGDAVISREDSMLWHISHATPHTVIKYFIVLPLSNGGQRAAWQPFLSSYGGVGGGIQSFMYLPGHESLPATVQVELPAGWAAATQLHRTGLLMYRAENAAALLDAQIMFGRLHQWKYMVHDIPHRVSYLSDKKAFLFDTLQLVKSIQKISAAADRLFGSLPYAEFNFLLSDNAYGALEHRNSTIAAAEANALADDPAEFYGELAHEYFHSWNLVRISPAEWHALPVYKDPPLAKSLWWLEGATIYYADLLLRRAHLPVSDSSGILHLQHLLAEYYSDAGNTRFSAEEVSMAANGPDDLLGDYSASTHTQGELICTMLDMLIRSRTDGKKTIDDLMRIIMKDFGRGENFGSANVQQELKKICGDDANDLFAGSVFGNKAIDVNRYLALSGMSAETIRPLEPGSGGDPDLRIYLYKRPGETLQRIKISDPQGCWGKAGVHTGDIILTVSGGAPKNNREFFSLLRKFKIGDEIVLEIQEAGGVKTVKVKLTGHSAPVIAVSEKQDISPRIKELAAQWKAGTGS